MAKHSSVEAYIAGFPIATQKLLQKVRKAIQQAAPKAVEIISYNMPAFSQNGILVYFAGYDHHIGFYPTSSGIREFSEEIKEYKNSKGAIQFPLNAKLPLDLIQQIVKFRLEECQQKALNKNQRTCPEGHQYIKSSSCPVCPICDKAKKKSPSWSSGLSAPARRALESAGINHAKTLATYSEQELLQLHGLGPASIPILKMILEDQGLHFK